MRAALPSILATLFLSTPGLTLAVETPGDEARRNHGLDPSVPLEFRVKPTSPDVLKLFDEPGEPKPVPHTLTEAERARLKAAFEGLPPLHRRILTERLRSVSFLDVMPNTALMSIVNAKETFLLYDITIRAGIFHENVSEWITQKERTCFDAKGSTLSVSIDAGNLDSLLFVLLHESTHIVDNALKIMRNEPIEGQPVSFAEGVWAERLTPLEKYREPFLLKLRYRQGGSVLPIADARNAYDALGRTPFVSLYGSNNWFDDLAEYLALYHMTEVLHQPYRISIRDGETEIFETEPMKKPLARERMSQMKRFYEANGSTTLEKPGE